MTKTKIVCIALLLASTSLCAQANDSAAALTETLNRLKGQQPLRGLLSLKAENQGGDELRLAQLQLPFEDGPQGLRLQYPQELLSRAEREELQRHDNPKAATPTASGIDDLQLRDVRDMARAADALLRRLKRASFQAETQEAWQGQPARKLRFSLTQSRPNKYVKDYSGVLDVWVNAAGQPLASRAVQKVSGRAMLVISFESSDEDELHYAVAGDRLVATRRQVKNSASGGGEKGSNNRSLSLQLVSG